MATIGKTIRKIKKAIGAVDSIKVSQDDQDLLEHIRKDVQLDADATEKQRGLELDDLRFCDPSTQWTDEERRSRDDAGRPCLTEDRLGPFINQVCNEQRKNKPGVQVNPVDENSDMETAEIQQGLIRHIEYSSNADTAYDTAFWWAATCGRGFYRLCTDYVDEGSFDQEIQIKRVMNPHLVFVDPSAQEADFSDMKWGGFKAWMTQADFKATYPNSQLANAGTDAWLSIGDDAEDWMSKDGGACLVVEHYRKESTPAKMHRLKDGRVVEKVPDGETPEESRDYMKTQVKWVKCTAVEILETADIPGPYIPIVSVLGKEVIIDGQRTWAGLIRAGKDPQKRHNYLLTSQVERIAFMPLATWIGAKGFMGKNAKLWATAHKNQMSTLEYEITGDEDKPINAPRLITEEAPIVAVTNALTYAEQGMKAVLGMYDPSLGNRDANQSGVAIQRLQTQGETGNYHLQDNLGRAIRYEGRIILAWLPFYYDAERVIRIVGEDGTQQQVRINGPVQNADEAPSKEAIGKTFDLTSGKYDITISAGPSYQSKRQEDRAMLLGMLQGPMGQLIAQRAGDLVAKTLDSPIAKELSERLVPPDIAQKEQQDQQIPPQLQQQMQAMNQQHEQLIQALHEAQNKIEAIQYDRSIEMQKAELDSKTKVAIAEMNNQTELLKVEAQITAQGVLPELKAKILELEQSQESIAQLAMIHHQTLMGQPSEEASEPQEFTTSQPGMEEMQQPTPPAIPAGGQTPMSAGEPAGMEEQNG